MFHENIIMSVSFLFKTIVTLFNKSVLFILRIFYFVKKLLIPIEIFHLILDKSPVRDIFNSIISTIYIIKSLLDLEYLLLRKTVHFT